MKIIGKPYDRVDAKAKVTGEAKYSGDWQEDNIAYAVIFQSQIANGKIKSFDLSAAKKIPGVIEILTYENAPRIKEPKAAPGSGPGESFVTLQDNKVYYNGQHIGAVIADSLEAATQAAQLVKVRYDSNKSELDFIRELKNSYEVKKMEGMGPISSERGDVKKALKTCDMVLSETYSTPTEHHNPMEPSATLAVWGEKEIKVYDATQGVFSISKLLGQSFKLEQDKVHVITKFVGGGFGCKGALWPHELIAVMASEKVRRPVKLVLSRIQMFTSVGHRAPTVQKITLGAKHDGELKAIEHICTNSTAVNKDYSERSAVLTQMLYKCENMNSEHHLVKLNYQVPTFMRAPGESSGSFAIESGMDELADKLQIDPIDLRLKNYADVDQKEKLPFSSKSLKSCYAQGAEKFNWALRSAKPRSRLVNDYLVGHGMATATYPANTFPAKAKVVLNADGKILVTSATQDIGTGTYTIMTQIAAETMGVPFENVKFDLGDSQFPEASVSGGSTTAASVGSAIKKGSADVINQLMDLAIADTQSPFHGEKKENLAWDNSHINHKTSKKSDSYVQIMKRNQKVTLEGKGDIGNSRTEKKKFSKHSFGAQFAEVRVHALTGEVRVTRLVGAFAAGRILNEKTAMNQFKGGMVFGMGMGLMEETARDVQSGRTVTKDLADYHVPVNADVPEIDIVFVEEQDSDVNPLGAKGIGEIGIVGTAAAIANAVYNATGVRIRDLPITPEKVLEGLKQLRNA